MVRSIKEKIIKLLRWSEKHTGTDMVYLVSNGSWLLLTQLVLSISGFTVVIILTNFLPKEVFGQYRFALSVIPILAIFTLPGIDSSLLRSVARDNYIDLRTIVKTKIKWGLIGSIIALLGSIYYIDKGNELLAYTFIISAIAIPLFETFSIYGVYYRGLHNFKTPAIYEAISRILQALLIVGTAFVIKNVLALVVAFFVGQIVTRLFFYLRTLRTIEYDSNNTDTNDTINYGKKLSIIGALGIIAAHIDKLLIWHFLGAEVLAIYVIALVIPLEIVRILGFIPQVAFPKFSKYDWSVKERRKEFYKKLVKITLLLTVGSALYIWLAPYILQLIFPKYPEIISLTILVAPIFVFSFVRMMLDLIFVVAKKTKYMLLFQTVDLLGYSILFLMLLVFNINLLTGAVLIFSVKLLLVVVAQMISLKILYK